MPYTVSAAREHELQALLGSVLSIVGNDIRLPVPD